MSGNRVVTAAGGAHFRAPMSAKLKLFTGGFLLLMVAVTLSTPAPLSLLPVAIVAVTATYSVRGYTVLPGVLVIHRLGWATRIPLKGLKSVSAEPDATLGSIRVFGVGGAFACVGRFRNSMLGSYRAYVTDPALCVVLDLGGETIAVTPDSPVRFAERVHLAAGMRP